MTPEEFKIAIENEANRRDILADTAHAKIVIEVSIDPDTDAALARLHRVIALLLREGLKDSSCPVLLDIIGPDGYQVLLDKLQASAIHNNTGLHGIVSGYYAYEYTNTLCKILGYEPFLNPITEREYVKAHKLLNF